LHLHERDRVMATWGPVRATSSHWYDVPEVVEHRLGRAGAGRSSDHVERFVAEHLGDRHALVALSVGCGTGTKELRWAGTGRLARLDAFDLSSDAIEAAKAAAAAAGVSDVTRFFVGDLFELPEESAQYDIVIFEDSLHHLTPLVRAVQKTERLLRPGGYVVINEYVGENRQQMSRETLRTANALLSAIPPRYRQRGERGVKNTIEVPSRLRMIMRDPSEAPESASILEALGERFEVLDITPLGGTLVYPLLDEIAQNFGDPTGRAILSALMSFEDALIDAGDLPSSYVFATYRRR
jgi:ubiquinone/menaquinone biosynthesis C-methylase UbiE